MQVTKKLESKLLGRQYVELSFGEKAGKLNRKQAVAALSQELGVPEENIGLIRLEEQAGTASVLGKFYVYESKESKARLHPKYLDERALSKEEKEKLKQERKKAKTPAPVKEAKK